MGENCVLVIDGDKQHRVDSSKRKRDELTSRRNELLGQLTEQMKVCIAKMNDESASESKREALRALLQQIRGKMDALSVPGLTAEEGFLRPERPVKGKGGKSKGKGKGGAIEEDEAAGGASFTLDNRVKVLRVTLPESWTLEKLREELKKAGALEEQILDIQSVPGADAALVRFSDRPSAEHIWTQRADLAFLVDWCSNPPAALRSPRLSPHPGSNAPPGALLTDEVKTETVEEMDSGARDVGRGGDEEPAMPPDSVKVEGAAGKLTAPAVADEAPGAAPTPAATDDAEEGGELKTAAAESEDDARPEAEIDREAEVDWPTGASDDEAGGIAEAAGPLGDTVGEEGVGQEASMPGN